MTQAPKGFPVRITVRVSSGWAGQTRLFGCLDSSELKGRYAFGSYTSRQRDEFELFFKTQTDADIAKKLWHKHLSRGGDGPNS